MTTSNIIELGKLFFEDGLPGFSHIQFFKVLQEDPDTPFLTLQSLDKDVEFWIVDPFLFFPEYEFDVNENTKTFLRITEDTPIAVANIVTLRPSGQLSINLKAPIVINQEKRIAKQVILSEDKYDVRQPLLQLKAKAASE